MNAQTVIKVDIENAKVLDPLRAPARYKAAHGGRGSGKSWFFASLLVEQHLDNPGFRSVCIREVQKSLKESAKRLIESKLEEYGFTERVGFRPLADRIETPGGGLIIFQGMQDHTAESIKSLEGFNRAWVEEAQTLSARSLQLLRPTIRAPGSELWFSWNPRSKKDPVDAMFRGGEAPTNSIVVRANWSDNPWFPAELEQERLDCLRGDPDQYSHIWDGDYVTIAEGAYFAKHLAQARADNRITDDVSPDPLMTTRAFFDIGGTGDKADATAIWIAQFVGTTIRILDYYEAVGQELSEHVHWLRTRGYQNAQIHLPHDGNHHSRTDRITYAGALREAGFNVEVYPNQIGAKMIRIDAARRLFPSMWFHKTRCAAGLEALGWYHERQDEQRSVGLGPEHDWSSHGCLLAGTLVETLRGMIPIENVRPGDQVKTPAGPANVSWSGETGRVGDLLRITLADGREIIATGSHKIFTTRGLVRADALGYSDAIFTEDSMPWLELASAHKTGYRDAFSASIAAIAIGGGPSADSTSRRRAAGSAFSTARHLAAKVWQSFQSMATMIISSPLTGLPAVAVAGHHPSIRSRSMVTANITCARTAITRTNLPEAPSCIGQSGKRSAGQSQQASTSTTSTTTKPTIGSKTSNCSQHPSTPVATRKPTHGLVATGPRLLSKRLRSRPEHGTGQTRAANGIVRMAAQLGRSVSSILSVVSSVVRDTSLPGRDGASFAARVARLEIVSGEPVPVYDLTVDSHHCYFANGVLVSNSDAFGLLALSYEAPRAARKITYSGRGIA